MQAKQSAKGRFFDWTGPVFRWVRPRPSLGLQKAFLESCAGMAEMGELLRLEKQKKSLFDNVQLFLRGLPANHALLAGAPGTGKTSLMESLPTHFADQGLRLIEVGPEDLIDLPEMESQLRERPEHFVIFCDDLPSLLPGETLRIVKNALERAAHNRSLLYCFCATCEVPQKDEQNLGSGLPCARLPREELPLADCCGLWISFPALTQEEYLVLAQNALCWCGVPEQEATSGDARLAALEFAERRAQENGRTAWQFARAYAGHLALKDG